MGVDLIMALFQQAKGQGSRSTALAPLGWLAAILGATFCGLATAKAEPYFVAVPAVLMVAAVGAYLGAYAFFARKDPDALRSEQFSLSKMALQRTTRGDDTIQLVHRTGAEPPALPPPPAGPETGP